MFNLVVNILFNLTNCTNDTCFLKRFHNLFIIFSICIVIYMHSTYILQLIIFDCPIPVMVLTFFCQSVFKAQLLSNNIDVTDLLRHSLKGRLTFSAISPLFLGKFGRSLRFCYLGFDEEAISDGKMAHYRVFRGGF